MYKEKIQQHIDDITKAISSIEKTIHEALSHPAKNFTIVYRGKSIEFFYPTTKKEQKDVLKKRTWFVNNLMGDAIRIKGWDTILGVVSGDDPRDHQFEKYEEIISEPNSDSVDRIKSAPLNLDNYQVEQELTVTCKNCTYSRIIGKDITHEGLLTTFCFNPDYEFCEWDK